MKKILTLAAGAAISLSLFAGTEKTSASSEETINSLEIEAFKEHTLKLLQEDYPNAQFIDLSPEEFEQQQNLKNISNITPYASAPPLEYLEVYAAWSTNNGGYEYFSPNQLSTVQDHGGTELYIVTAEIGYGHIRTTKINGNKLTELQRQYIDLEGDTIVDGWYIWWDASGNESGTFTYQNTSTNSPWNTMSDNMYIK